MKLISIKTPRGKRLIGPGQPAFIVAEMSGNHNHSLKRAYQIIDQAARAGADAVKIQTYTPDTITLDCDNDFFQVKVNKAWKGQSLHQLYQKAYTPWAWQPRLKKYAEKKGLVLFSTPFDSTAVDFLEKMKVRLYKVASFEVVDIPLLQRIGKTKKPVIISRGMSNLAELKLALKTLRQAGCPQVAVLHCVSSYPAKPDGMNLKTIPDLAKRLKVISGLSDHSLGPLVPLTAVALGASIIEKHLTLKRSDGGPDAAFSLEPAELKRLVKEIRETEKSIGRPMYQVAENEKESVTFRKSLFVVKDIKQGEKITIQNVRSIRPGYGLLPKYFTSILGKKIKKNLEAGTPLAWKFISR